MFRKFLLITVFFSLPLPAYSCPDGWHEQCVPLTRACACAPNGPDVPDIDIDDVFNTANDFIKIYVEVLPRESVNFVNDAINNIDKGIADTAKNLVKAAHDIADAAQAISRYAKREISGLPNILSNADQRFREGKVVDAVWHLATEPTQQTSNNASQLVRENEIVASAAQAAANFYGGPAGSAAFAAWNAYQVSGGRVDLALKAGAFAYTTHAGYATTSALPTGSVGDVARKAATTGAIAGLAVAASGATDEDTLEAFLKSGGAVVVQSGQAYVNEYIAENVDADALMIEADSYCTSILGGTCDEVQEWAEEAEQNAEQARNIAQTKPAVVLTPDRNWAITWVPSAHASEQTNTAPSVALTYIGAGSPYFEKLQEIAALTGKTVPSPTHPLMEKNTGWIYLGRRHSDGTWLGPRSFDIQGRNLDELPGLVIDLNKEVNLHTGPRIGCNVGDDKPIIETMKVGQQVTIVSAIRLRPGCSNYIWAQVNKL